MSIKELGNVYVIMSGDEGELTKECIDKICTTLASEDVKVYTHNAREINDRTSASYAMLSKLIDEDSCESLNILHNVISQDDIRYILGHVNQRNILHIAYSERKKNRSLPVVDTPRCRLITAYWDKNDPIVKREDMIESVSKEVCSFCDNLPGEKMRYV